MRIKIITFSLVNSVHLTCTDSSVSLWASVVFRSVVIKSCEGPRNWFKLEYRPQFHEILSQVFYYRMCMTPKPQIVIHLISMLPMDGIIVKLNYSPFTWRPHGTPSRTPGGSWTLFFENHSFRLLEKLKSFFKVVHCFLSGVLWPGNPPQHSPWAGGQSVQQTDDGNPGDEEHPGSCRSSPCDGLWTLSHHPKDLL